jgi:acyl-[acyl-carrier-protein]-phospholipid O-acyltransferase / long-chain-fatty-acid--[acyl-carrier-protein] ligase
MRTFVRFLIRILYRFRAYNEAVLSTPGPVLLVPNHVSWLDWVFLGVCLEEDWKFVTSSVTAQASWLHRKIMVNRFTFPIDMTSPYAVKHMAEFLNSGGRLVLFAEGRITLTGNLMKIFDGTGFLLHKTNAKVITCYLRGANRIPFVRRKGWTRFFQPVSAHYSAVLQPPKVEHLSTSESRKILTDWLRDRMVEHQFETEMTHGQPTALGAIAEMASIRPRDIVLEDISRQTLNYRRIMVGTALLSKQWHKLLSASSHHRVGVLLPNVNGMPVVLLSLWTAGQVPAILNYSSGPHVMLTCCQLAGLKQIITSRLFLERAKLDIHPLTAAGLELIYLEDVRPRISGVEKLVALFKQILNPKSAIRNPPVESTGVILFTSGSEGLPKGVELTHRNLVANVRQMLAVIDLEDRDRLFNALPQFHSFGLTVGTLLPLMRGIYCFIYPSPLHYRVVPAAVYDRACTILLGTNTFLNGYARKAHPYDFRSVRYLFAGAEKLQEATANTWARKFGIRILEGYGATECSPCVSVNTAVELCFGSAGKFLPAIDYRLEPVEGVPEGGRLFVRGPNIMKGYLNPDANDHFQKLGGWYDTGDIVSVDQAGFLHILGRLKRFAKISGEMVSLTAVEDALAGAFPNYGLRCEVAILNRPDEEKGEALVAVTNEPRLPLEEIRSVLRRKGFPNLASPRELKIVREIPKLGTGKVNHRELAKMV